VARRLNAELTHPVAERVWMKFEDPRGALWPVNHAAGILKRGKDVVSFYLIQCQ
jgi:hypothetical protein